MANYVKFLRGSQEAYDLLKLAGKLDNNTLYFIYDDADQNTGALYLGARIISGGNAAITSANLDDLADVIANGTGANSFLVKNEEDIWVAKSLEGVIALIEGNLQIDPAITENVSKLQDSVNNIVEDLRSVENALNGKVDSEFVNEELAKKADAETVNTALNEKANIEDVNTALDKKADIDTVNAELNKKADTETINAALNEKANISDVYTKEEVNNKVATEINTAISNVDHLQRKIVNNLDEIDEDAIDAHLYIYMVPTGLQQDDDKYDEYMIINGIIEKVGSWEVDLSQYATKEEVAKKVDIDETARLMTLLEGNKLSTIEENAQVNIINSISTDFTIDINNNKQLILNTLPISKIENLQESLNNKVDAQAGYTLLSPDDLKKLAALVIGEDNNLEISGSVNADNVQGLEEWLNKNAGTMPGLSENNLTDELYTKLNDSLFISSIDTSQLNVTAGKLSVLEIDQSKITGLVEALNVKTNQSDFENLQIIVSEVQNSLADYVLKTQYDEDIADIYDRLTWKDI